MIYEALCNLATHSNSSQNNLASVIFLRQNIQSRKNQINQ